MQKKFIRNNKLDCITFSQGEHELMIGCITILWNNKLQFLLKHQYDASVVVSIIKLHFSFS